jgi:hypothetical protein
MIIEQYIFLLSIIKIYRAVAASCKYFSAIHPTPHLTSTHLTPDYVNTMILHLVSVLYTAVNA